MSIQTPTYTNSWFVATAQKNFELISPRFAGKPTRVLEIGCFEGRSSNWIVDNICNHRESSLTCVDPFTGSDEHTDEERNGLYSRFLSNISHNADKIRIIKKPSLLALVMMIELGEKFDLIYVDGDHKSSSVVVDAILSDKLLVPGGIIIFDDYAWKAFGDDAVSPSERPKEAIEYFFGINSERYDILAANWQIVANKKID